MFADLGGPEGGRRRLQGRDDVGARRAGRGDGGRADLDPPGLLRRKWAWAAQGAPRGACLRAPALTQPPFYPPPQLAARIAVSNLHKATAKSFVET
jgi:hypothetical protein